MDPLLEGVVAAAQPCSLALLLPAALHAQAEAPSGADLLSQGRTARAIAQLENALGRNPFDPVALNNLVNTSSTGVKRYNVDMAGAIITALPTLVVYIIAGRYFMRGLTAGAVKG